MKVNLTYYKRTGKFYSEGSYETPKKHLHEIFAEVRNLLVIRNLPGLMHGHSNFIVGVDVPKHPHRHPHLVIEDD